MDPTLAALAGALLGMAGTVLTPGLSARHQRKARRRELMRHEYADAMRVVSDVPRCKNLDDYAQLRERLFEAQNQIRLVGSRRTSNLFDEFVQVVERFFDIVNEEAPRFRPLVSPKKRVDETFPAELRAEVGERANRFILAARRDMGTEDPVRHRAWRAVRRRLKRTPNESP